MSVGGMKTGGDEIQKQKHQPNHSNIVWANSEMETEYAFMLLFDLKLFYFHLPPYLRCKCLFISSICTAAAAIHTGYIYTFFFIIFYCARVIKNEHLAGKRRASPDGQIGPA